MPPFLLQSGRHFDRIHEKEAADGSQVGWPIWDSQERAEARRHIHPPGNRDRHPRPFGQLRLYQITSGPPQHGQRVLRILGPQSIMKKQEIVLEDGKKAVQYYEDDDNDSGYGDNPRVGYWYGALENSPERLPDNLMRGVRAFRK